MAITLLAVDDSVTMRKVLEITFASPDFRVVSANSADLALQRFKTDRPDLVISDLSLDPKNGYELCKAVKQLSPATPVLLLSSKHNPFDSSKGAAAQADDHIDKPFDTQQIIDKVKKMVQNRGDSAVMKPPVAQPAAAAPTMASPAVRTPVAEAKAPSVTTAAASPAASAASAAPVQRAKTLIYNPPAGAQVPAQAAAPVKAPAPAVASTVATAKPVVSTSIANQTSQTAGMPRQKTVALGPSPSPSPPAVAPPANAAVATAVNSQMAGKLEGMGLTQAQIEGVLALSRDIIERVVWEVVPVMAETLIKEELARLTK